MPSRHDYLDALEREARRTLPFDEAAAFVAEAGDHLEQSIQARLELGTSPEEAEREAVEAFGAVSRAARFVPEDQRLRWLAVFFVGLVLQPLSIRFLNALGTEFLVGGIVLGNGLLVGVAFAFASACFRVRRPALPSLLFGLLLAVTIPVAYAKGVGHGGFGQGFRRLAYESPTQALTRTLSARPHGAKALMGVRRTIVWVDEYRHEVAFLVGGPLGVDLSFGGLGALAFAARRRPQGGLRA